MILTERLKVNNVEIPLTGYSVKTPTGGLGQSLTVALAKPDLAAIPLDAVIKFEVGAGAVIDGEITYSYVTILDTGKLSGRQYTVKWIPDERGGYPGDILEINSLSPLADRLGISPAVPVIIYDPKRVNGDTLKPQKAAYIRAIGENGEIGTLEPQLEAIEGLTVHQILDRAYKTGCGFSRVVTNIPNSPVERVDFTLESGFHSPASNLISFWDAVVFEDNNILYILSPDLDLPEGFTFRQLELDCVVEIGESLQPSTISNGIILSYKPKQDNFQYGGEKPPEIKIINDEPIITGEGKSYSRIEVKREVTNYYDQNSGELRRSLENWTETTTFAYRDNIEVTEDAETGLITRERVGGNVKTVSFERLTNTYTGKTKSGYNRTIEALYISPETGGYEFSEVLRERGVIDWTADLSHPGEYKQVRSKIEISGLVLVETKEDGLKVYTPILSATQNGIVETEGQSLLDTPIVTIIEELRETGQNQADVIPRIIPHIQGGADFAPLQSRPGNRSTHLPPFALRGGDNPQVIRELITDAESVSLYGLRKPQTLDVGELDPVEGRKLAKIKIKNNLTPPKTYNVILPGIDFLIRRGSLIIAPLRSGYTGGLMVTGWNMAGRQIGTPQAWRNMTMETRSVNNGD